MAYASPPASGYFAAGSPPQYVTPGPYTATYTTVPPQSTQFYYVVQQQPQTRPRKCIFRVVCETLGWLTSAVVCTLCSAACGAASCCINGFVEDEFVPSKPQHQ
ncbi:hypothetical protein BESB_010300 [Besnoitia besnoiti]|uniref:Uncharacterized protein n=1 Tax=Besnoitia besnoiti TaxID=94643 RepID=A0A2A9MJG8_BESBE|nr:hypothetical protein BESB_010300 [Besnoitia besnoiti]PFH38688.1 hypothetical protein BESB_010300 [Besnoitia besnoiti]